MIDLKELLNPDSFLFIQDPTSKKMVFDKICSEAFEKYNIIDCMFYITYVKLFLRNP